MILLLLLFPEFYRLIELIEFFLFSGDNAEELLKLAYLNVVGEDAFKFEILLILLLLILLLLLFNLPLLVFPLMGVFECLNI